MTSGLFFPLSCLFFSALLTFVYFKKERINSQETKVYGWLIITNLVGLIIELSCYYFVRHVEAFPVIGLIVLRVYLVYLLAWLVVFTHYILVVSFSSKNVKIPKKNFNLLLIILYTIFIFFSIITLVLPMEIFCEDGMAYTYGASINFTYFASVMFIGIILLCLAVNFKNIKNKKYTPVFFFIVFGSILAVIQLSNPGILLMTSMETFITFLMYFTIENPDVKMIEQLNVARDQAEKANAAKTDFLSNMSHEIRTPLNAIVGFSNLLLEKEDIPNSAKEEVKDIIMASDNLLEIVNGILDISKIEANKLEIVNTEYSIRKLTDELVALTKGRLGEKPIEFRTNFDESIPNVLYGDVQRIKQICVNILTNAVKYTKSGWIDFTISSVKKDNVIRLIISVEDTGIGIKQENINKLFNKFERIDLEENLTIEGTGLGLAITKKLVELMKGKIVVQSTFGKGSKFTVSIDQRIVKKPTLKEEVSESTEKIDVKDKIVLLVDDNKINLKVAERLLDSYGIKTESVLSGFDCLEYLETKEYSLILLDDMMPKMSGVETLKKIKIKYPKFKTPVIALTANALTGMKEKYIQDGFDDYLAKPIDKKELNRVINKYLNKD